MLKYNYSDGKLTKFTHLEDDSLICLNKVNYEFVYNTSNLLSGIKDGESNLYSIEYNSNKATKVKYPNNEYYTLNYSDELTTVTKTNENGKNIYTEKTNFDTDTGKILIETDTDNNKVNYFYENSNNKYLVTKTSKIVDYQELNSNNELVTKTKVVVTTTDYNENEDIVEEVDENKTSHNFVGLEGNTISTMRYNLTGLEYYIYNKDIKGSTTNIIDNNQNAKISYKYSDFGETKEYGDTNFYNEICYTGGIYDESTALYYLNARYYNPEDAIFITQDTYRGEVNKPSTLHLYAYCANNPINYIDPTGHTLCVISHVITGFVIISMSATRSIVISSSGRIGVAKSASIGISIGPNLAKKVSANTGVQVSLYGNTSRIGDLNGHSIDASMSASVGVYNMSVGTSISVKKKSSKGKVLPVVSVGVPAVASFDISANLNITYSRVIAFPFSIDYYKGHKKKKYNYTYFGEKQKIEKNSTFIDVKYSGLKLRLYNEKKYNIK